MVKMRTELETSGIFRHLRTSVEGRMVGEWALLVEREVGVQLEKRLPLALDLTGVMEIDAVGHEVIGRIAAHGIDVDGLPLTDEAGRALATA